MDFGPLRRPAVALVAAYAVALQALLTAFIPSVPAALTDPFAVLCSQDKTHGTGQPAHHDAPCAAICAAMGQGIAGAVPPDVVVVIVVPHAVTAAEPFVDWMPPQIAVIDSHAPRGPPLA